MANPAKRKVTAGNADEAPEGSAPGSSAPSKRVTPPKATRAASRYTPPNPQSQRGPSPRWVPVLMFALWLLGLLLIILNYMGLLPGAGDGGNGWYLIAGLGAILGGIMVATQYR
jgi:hypothetical protein